MQCKRGGYCQEEEQDLGWDLQQAKGNETFTWKSSTNQGVTQPVSLDDTKEESKSNKQSQSCTSGEHVERVIFFLPTAS